MCRDLKNIEITSGQLKLRELKLTKREINDIFLIVRDYAEFSTMRLYKAYKEKREEIEKCMKKTNLIYLFQVFHDLDEHTLYTDSQIIDKLHNRPDKDLFSPYGPMNENELYFTKRMVRTYIEDAKIKNKPLRNSFRMGIEYENRLIGCIVFDTIVKNINLNGNQITVIGDIGVFLESSNYSRRQLARSIQLMLYFVDKYLELENKDELFISMTTHLCNQETEPLLRSIRGFQRDEKLILTEHGLRKHYVISYSKIKNGYLRDPENITVKIGNTVMD